MQRAGAECAVVPDLLLAGQSLPYAWDEPAAAHTLLVTARAASATPDALAVPLHAPGASRRLDVDALASKAIPPLVLKGGQFGAGAADDETALGLVLGAQRKVFVDVFADGPTRVVRFSDAETAPPVATGVAEVAQRVHHLQLRLDETDRQFSALRGTAAPQRLDVFSHATVAAAAAPGGGGGGALPAAAARALALMVAGTATVTLRGARGLPAACNTVARLEVSTQVRALATVGIAAFCQQHGCGCAAQQTVLA